MLSKLNASRSSALAAAAAVTVASFAFAWLGVNGYGPPEPREL